MGRGLGTLPNIPKAFWWDNNDLEMIPKTAEVRIAITSTIVAQKRQMRSLSTSTQRINVDKLVA